MRALRLKRWTATCTRTSREAQSAKLKVQCKLKMGARTSPVGVIGLGIMGSAMAVNLMRAGYRVIGYDVLDKRRRALARAGGETAPSCRAVGHESGIIICSLPSSEALVTTAQGLVETRSPHVVIETSTLPIAVKEAARARLA